MFPLNILFFVYLNNKVWPLCKSCTADCMLRLCFILIYHLFKSLYDCKILSETLAFSVSIIPKVKLDVSLSL
jgi:hypothetical protein